MRKGLARVHMKGVPAVGIAILVSHPVPSKINDLLIVRAPAWRFQLHHTAGAWAPRRQEPAG